MNIRKIVIWECVFAASGVQKEAEGFNLTMCLSQYWEIVRLFVVKGYLIVRNLVDDLQSSRW